MSVRMRITHGKTRSRRSHHRVVSVRLAGSSETTLRRKHFADPETGLYRGKQIGKVSALSLEKKRGVVDEGGVQALPEEGRKEKQKKTTAKKAAE